MPDEDATDICERFHRRAQPGGGSEGCVYANLTEFGRRVHDIRAGDDLIIEVRDEEIVVKKHPGNSRREDDRDLDEF